MAEARGTFPQPALSGGELAPSLHGRVDLAVYQTSVKSCPNFIPQAFGGLKNRPGSWFVAGCKTNTRYSRLVPFSFNATQNYVLEFSGGISPSTSGYSVLGEKGSDGTMRVYSYGKQVVYKETYVDGNGVSHTAGDPVELEIPWYMADLRGLRFSQSGDVLTVTHPLYPPCEIQRYDNDRWAIRKMPFNKGPFKSINAEAGTKVGASRPDGDVILTANVPIFTDDKVGQLFYLKQSTFGIPWEAGKQVTAGDIRRSDGKYYKAKTSGKTGSLRPIHDNGDWWDGGPGGGSNGTDAGGVLWTFLNPGYGVARILTASGTTATATLEPNTRFPEGVCGVSITDGTTSIPITAVGQGAADPTGSYTYLRVDAPGHGRSSESGWFNAGLYLKFWTAGNDQKVLSFDNLRAIAVNSTTIDCEISYDLLAQNDYASLVSGASSISPITNSGGAADSPAPSHLWAFGAWGGAQGWPTCSGYFQQRHVFAGSTLEPQTVWASRTGDFYDFSTSNPIEDDDSLTWTIASSKMDGINNLLPMDKLVLFTLGGNWVTIGGQNEVLTPGNINTKLQNYYGSATLPPLGIGNTALYYGRNGTIRDMAYDFASDTYTGNDLTLRANHLFLTHTLLEWDFQQVPFPCVWAVRDDGVLLSMSYLREERVMGWAPHTLSGEVESVAVINECGEDHVYVVVKRTINGGTKRYIECLYGRVEDNLECCFVDSALRYDGRNVTSGVTMTATGTYTQGGSVTVVCAGTSTGPFVGATDVGDQVVLESSAGTIHRVTIVTSGSPDAFTCTGTLDSALPADLQGMATDSWAIARDQFTGLGHLVGETVSVYADGTTYTEVVQSPGTVYLTGHPGYVVTVGFPIVAELEPLPLVVPGQEGPMRDHTKLITTVRLQVENSRSCYIGPDEDNLVLATVRDEEDVWTPVTTLGSGILEAQCPARWNRNGSFFLRHTEATPLSILALYPFAGVGGV